jgi:hypothetical protein
MNERFELTDELIDQALRVERFTAPAEIRSAVYAAVTASPRGGPTTRWMPALPAQRSATLLWLVVALLLALAAVAVGSRLLELRDLDTSVLPSPSQPSTITAPPSQPTQSPGQTLPSPAAGTFSLFAWETPDRDELRFEYRVPAGVGLNIETLPSVVGFAVGADGLGYGRRSDGTGSIFVDNARGIVLADITGVILWGEHDRPAPRNAAEFLDRMTLRYRLSETSAGQLAGFPALVTDVTSTPPFAQLEWGDHETNGVFLRPSNRLVVTDIGDRMLLAQIWVAQPSRPVLPIAELEQRLATWLPVATEFIESLTLAQPSEGQ